MPRDRTLAFVYFVALTSANLYIDLGVLERHGRRVASGTRQALLRLRGRRAAAPARCSGPSSCAALVHELGADAAHHPGLRLHRGRTARAESRWRAARCAARRTDRRVPDGAIPVGGRALDDLRAWRRTPYLLGIAGMIIAGQTIGAFMYNEQGKYVAAALHRDGGPRRDVREPSRSQ